MKYGGFMTFVQVINDFIGRWFIFIPHNLVLVDSNFYVY